MIQLQAGKLKTTRLIALKCQLLKDDPLLAKMLNWGGRPLVRTRTKKENARVPHGVTEGAGGSLTLLGWSLGFALLPWLATQSLA